MIMIQVGKEAPDFELEGFVDGRFIRMRLSDYRGKWVVLFFWPLDFTFVCPTELHAFQDNLESFKERNTEVIACSVDSPFSHLAWLQTPKKKGGIEGIEFPILSDLNKKIAIDYDVLSVLEGIAYRGLFLIDKQGVVRHQVVNDLPIGRSIEETLRVIDALNHHEKVGEVCPANWQVGKKAMQPTQEALEHYYA